jgi:hypothetical protein
MGSTSWLSESAYLPTVPCRSWINPSPNSALSSLFISICGQCGDLHTVLFITEASHPRSVLPVCSRQLKCKWALYTLGDEITCFDRLVPCAFASPSGRYCHGAVRLRNVIGVVTRDWCAFVFWHAGWFILPCTVEVFSSNLIVWGAEAS